MNEYKAEQNDTERFVSDTLADNFLKLAKVNLLTGEYKFLKKEENLTDDGYEDITNIYSYIKQQVEDKSVLLEHAEDYLRFSDPEYVQKRIFSGEKRVVQSYKRRTSEGYMWVTFGILAPEECSRENPWVVFMWREADSDTTTMLDALATLSAIYYKILKINLDDDSFEIIKASDEERMRYEHLAKISDWWRMFAEDGNIHPGDIDEYKAFTDIDSLRRTFTGSDITLSCRYRRKSNDGFRYAQMDLTPSIEYTEKNRVLILYVKDIHEEYIREKCQRRRILDYYQRFDNAL